MNTNFDTLRTPVSIGDEVGYQEAMQEMLDAYAAFAKHEGATAEQEQETAYKLAEAAAGSAWHSLTALIDCYVARRIREAFEKP